MSLDPKTIYPPDAELTGAPPPSYDHIALYPAPSNEQVYSPTLYQAGLQDNTIQPSPGTTTQPFNSTLPPYPTESSFADGGEPATQYGIPYQAGDTQENSTVSPSEDLPARTDISDEAQEASDTMLTHSEIVIENA